MSTTSKSDESGVFYISFAILLPSIHRESLNFEGRARPSCFFCAIYLIATY